MKKEKKKQETPDPPELKMAEEQEATMPEREEPAAAGAETMAEEQNGADASQETTPEEEAVGARLLRLQADFDNYRRRTLRERAETQRSANEELLQELLPVVDHYEMGLNTAEKHGADPAVLDGFRLVYDQFLGVLRKQQVTPIEAEGQLFDHNLHEAITYVPSEEHPVNTIIAETRRGYLLGDKLLRPAQVVVSSGPTEGDPEPPDIPGDEKTQEN